MPILHFKFCRFSAGSSILVLVPAMLAEIGLAQKVENGSQNHDACADPGSCQIQGVTTDDHLIVGFRHCAGLVVNFQDLVHLPEVDARAKPKHGGQAEAQPGDLPAAGPGPVFCRGPGRGRIRNGSGVGWVGHHHDSESCASLAHDPRRKQGSAGRFLHQQTPVAICCKYAMMPPNGG